MPGRPASAPPPALEEYVATHGINELFSDALTAVLEKQPRDPAAFLALHFSAADDRTQHGAGADDLMATIAQKEAEIARLEEELAKAHQEVKRVEKWASNKPRLQSVEELHKHTKAESFGEDARQWAESKDAALPKDLRLQIVAGAVEQIAPLLIKQRHMNKQLEEVTAQQKRCDDRTHVIDIKEIEHNVETVGKAVEEANKQLAAALEHLDQITRTSCSAMTEQLVADRDAYRGAVVELDAAEDGALLKLSELSQKLVNKGPLKVGSEVQVEGDGEMKRAKVLREVERDGVLTGEWEVSLWQYLRAPLPAS